MAVTLEVILIYLLTPAFRFTAIDTGGMFALFDVPGKRGVLDKRPGAFDDVRTVESAIGNISTRLALKRFLIGCNG